jgi:hypothetical protein
MAAIDPWEKAADCERAAQATPDPLRRNILLKLQSLWVTLANESGVMTPAELASEAERIGRVQADLVPADLPMMIGRSRGTPRSRKSASPLPIGRAQHAAG